MSYLDNAVNGAEGAFVDRAIAQLKQADADVDTFRQVNAQLSASREDLKSAAVAIENLNRVLGEENDTRRGLERNVQELQQEVEKLRADLDFCQKANAHLMNDHVRAQEELAVMRMANSASLNKVTVAQSDIGSVLRKLVHACEVLRSANSTLEKAKEPAK